MLGNISYILLDILLCRPSITSSSPGRLQLCQSEKFSPLSTSPSSLSRNLLKSHNTRISQGNSLSHQSHHEYSSSNYSEKHSKAQKLQEKDGIGDEIGGRTWRGIFGGVRHVDAHYLHNARSLHIRCTLFTHCLHNARSPHIPCTFLTHLSPSRDW